MAAPCSQWIACSPVRKRIVAGRSTRSLASTQEQITVHMSTDELIGHVHASFARIYLGGIPSTLNDNAAFLSFICTLTGIEALGGFLKPTEKNGPRFKTFIAAYFPQVYHSHVDELWKFRNAAVHGFSPGPYKLTHHNGHLHMTVDGGRTLLNAEDFYAALVMASEKYFSDLKSNVALQASFMQRVNDVDTGVLAVGPLTGSS